MATNNAKRPKLTDLNLDVKDVDNWTDDEIIQYIVAVAYDTNTNRETQLGWYNRYTTYEKPIDTMDAPDYISDDEDAPDYRIQNAFEKEIVDNLVYYLASIEPTINLQDDALNDKFKMFKNVSSFHGKLLDTLKFAGACGTGAMIMYQDMEDVRVMPVRGYEYYVLYDTNGSDTLFAIRFYSEQLSSDFTQWYAEFYTPTKVVYFKGGSTIMSGYNKTSQEPHYFGIVPLIEMSATFDEFPVFYPVRRLIDAYDRLVSDYSNEIENFRHAIMVLINYGATPEDIATLRKTRTIQISDDGDVKFLTKDINPEAFSVLKDILEKNIERFSGTLNYTDPEVYGRATNLAISTRLQPLDNNAKSFGIRAKQMVYKLVKGLANFWGKAKNTPAYDWRVVEIAWNYDRPVNHKELVEEADLKQNSLGMSRKDAWQGLGYDSVDKVIERADEDKEILYGEIDDTEE